MWNSAAALVRHRHLPPYQQSSIQQSTTSSSHHSTPPLSPMIDGVKIIPLRQIVDERGKIMHMLKATDPHFIKFGEIYFSCAWPGTIKAWHIHKSMTINNAVICGRAKLVMYDLRKDSPTKGELQEVFFGEDNYV